MDHSQYSMIIKLDCSDIGHFFTVLKIFLWERRVSNIFWEVGGSTAPIVVSERNPDRAYFYDYYLRVRITTTVLHTRIVDPRVFGYVKTIDVHKP